MTIRAVIVDDEAPARERLEALLAAEPDVSVVASCANGPDAVDVIAEQAPGLVFLDIQMPEMDGFEVLDALGPDAIPALVFVTAWDDFTLRAFEARAIDYLLKPFTEARFAEALRRARRLLAGDAARTLQEEVVAGLLHDRLPPPIQRRIAVRLEGRVLFLRPPEIDWIESAGNYVLLHVKGAAYLLRATLRRTADRLHEAGFRRIHHSFIVNMDRVRSVERLPRGEYRVTMEDGTALETSRSFAANLDPLA